MQKKVILAALLLALTMACGCGGMRVGAPSGFIPATPTSPSWSGAPQFGQTNLYTVSAVALSAKEDAFYAAMGRTGLIRRYTFDKSSMQITQADQEVQAGVSVGALVLSPEEDRLYLGVENKLAEYELPSLKKLRTMDLSCKWVRAMALTPDGKELVVAGKDGNLLARVDRASLKVLNTADLDAVPYEVAVSPDGKQVAVGLSGKKGDQEFDKVSFFSLPGLEPGRTLELPGLVEAVEFSPQGGKLLVSGAGFITL